MNDHRESVTIQNNGQKIFGMLHKPLNVSGKIPAVLMCHGFAGNKTGKFRIYVAIAELLAKHGIASLRIDFRGSGDSEGEFNEMTLEGEVSDAVKCLEFLSTLPFVDKDRLGILGNSFGGAVSVLAASQFGKIKSMALLAALFSNTQWRQMWEALQTKVGDESSLKDVMRAFEGNIPGPGFYKGFFQMNIEPHLLKLNNIPLLHIHSLKDDRISMTEANQYERCRKDAKGDTRYVRLEKCDHSFSHPEERQQVIEESANWFKKTL